ncbi:SDR family NAD(P)-dependent oxidoreductase [Brachybacterium sp. p3-SID957]|uniref:SDR family NAD(P)-dependent oxidoreductase n=1 Tax=Brachybacterium sp. p3-SID957 TaxID=2916049 RepID=UPI00223AD91D|nr:SDR family NAD(P)-dependent oxidoreductase [Brachybacterium sp. p3-SID957]MCT1775811.1 SDR family NAD(P)-dependent oxidoreductase [Brachybacterium sp. p3-SID957]
MALTPARFNRPASTPEVSIVTGGASGVGRALATSLVQRGGRVIIADRDAAAAPAHLIRSAQHAFLDWASGQFAS